MKLFEIIKNWFSMRKISCRYELWLQCADGLPELQIYDSYREADFEGSTQLLRDPFVVSYAVITVPL